MCALNFNDELRWPCSTEASGGDHCWFFIGFCHRFCQDFSSVFKRNAVVNPKETHVAHAIQVHCLSNLQKGKKSFDDDVVYHNNSTWSLNRKYNHHRGVVEPLFIFQVRMDRKHLWHIFLHIFLHSGATTQASDLSGMPGIGVFFSTADSWLVVGTPYPSEKWWSSL